MHNNEIMGKNIGKKDKTIRIVVGLGLISLMFIGPKTLLGLLGIPFLITGLFGHCILYSMFDFSTCKVENKAD